MITRLIGCLIGLVGLVGSAHASLVTVDFTGSAGNYSIVGQYTYDSTALPVQANGTYQAEYKLLSFDVTVNGVQGPSLGTAWKQASP